MHSRRFSRARMHVPRHRSVPQSIDPPIKYHHTIGPPIPTTYHMYGRLVCPDEACKPSRNSKCQNLTLAAMKQCTTWEMNTLCRKCGLHTYRRSISLNSGWSSILKAASPRDPSCLRSGSSLKMGRVDFSLLWVFALFMVQTWCQTVQDDWTAPAAPDGSTSLQSGTKFTLLWKSGLQNSFETYCPSCNTKKLDLWITNFNGTKYTSKIGRKYSLKLFSRTR
jgi:hypothetical protein